MTRLKRAAVVLTIFSICLVSARSVIGAPLEPYQYVLALQRLQDQVVAGDQLAHKAQQEMLQYMAGDFSKVRIVDWQKQKNAEALLIYLLSGGNPVFVGELLEIKNPPKLPDGVMAGALAFVMGDFGRAKTLLATASTKELSINARSQIALLKAAIYAEKDYKKALGYLAEVRLWKPGTLLEEAALRRAVSLAGANGEIEGFLRWSSQYVRRFEKSFYLPDFVSKFSFYMSKLNLAGRPKFIKPVVKILSQLSREQQASIYLTVARAAVLDGNNQQAQFMATQAQLFLEKGTSYSARAKLYFTASQVTAAKPEKITKSLTEIDRSLLIEQDKKIFDTLVLMMAEVQKEPQTENMTKENSGVPRLQGKPGERQMEQVSPVVAKAQELIASAVKLLGEN
ncbi:hypothetical protein MNBD_ALPHA08-1570 [hydrothermal vent metagenome]|uniref:Chemotaxis protein MotC n=1 Tax=hydrothermal vent metagenome TaxID=652676 RepID=A0A3B0RXH1_9ZZZZ